MVAVEAVKVLIAALVGALILNIVDEGDGMVRFPFLAVVVWAFLSFVSYWVIHFGISVIVWIAEGVWVNG